MINKDIKNVIFITGESATGKTFISNELDKFLKQRFHSNNFILYLGDSVRADQENGIEPAYSMKSKTDAKILLSKKEIQQLMEYYLKDIPENTQSLIIEGFPRTIDDMDLMENELKTKYYNNAKISLVNMYFKDQNASEFGMTERQKIDSKFRKELNDNESRKRKAENYKKTIKPAIEYAKEKYPNIDTIDLELKSKIFFDNFIENELYNNSIFKKLTDRIQNDFYDIKYEKENIELSKQIKIK